MFKNKRVYYTLIVVFSLIIVASLAVITLKLWPEKEDFNDFKEKTSNVSSEQELPDNPIDFGSLLEQSPNVCGYIKVDGTAVDYPVMRSSDEQKEDYYLDHDWLGKSKMAGSIYMQKYNAGDFSNPCTVLYGHNMLNGSMFGTLKKFRNGDFFKENRNITVYTPGHILTYEIFSAFVYDDRHILYSFNFSKSDEYQSFLNQVTSPKSLVKQINPDVVPTTEDKIIVLSTCTSVDTERYLVVGRLKEDVLTK